VSDTADATNGDIQKMLDNGWAVSLFLNGMGSYTAEATKGSPAYGQTVITDDFTPLQALYRLAEKVTTGRIA
jgi:hypothetical protein